MKFARKTSAYIILFFVVLGGVNLLALYFKNNSMQLALVYHRITGGTSFEVDGNTYEIPGTCFKAPASADPLNLASFFCVHSATELRNVNVYRLATVDIEKWRATKSLVDVYAEQGDLIYVEAGSMQGASIPMPISLLPGKAIGIAADDKSLGEVFVQVIQRPQR